MFKTSHNMMKIQVKITPQTPVLVSSGKTFDVTRPDMEFFRIKTNDGETIYIPGSSIKGVLRAGLEAVLSENKKFTHPICSASETMCHDRQPKDERTNKVSYANHCPVCRLFGSGHLAARLEISDVFPFHFDDSSKERREKIEAINQMISSRTGIQIDRKTGKTKGGALFDYEILGGGELFGEFTLTNYELYQPGLLFTLFDLANEGFLRFGHSRSRGLGVLHFQVQSMKILQMGKLRGPRINGIGLLPGLINRYQDYGFFLGDDDFIDKEFPVEDQFLYSTITLEETGTIDEAKGLMRSKIQKFLEGKEA